MQANSVFTAFKYQQKLKPIADDALGALLQQNVKEKPRKTI